MKRIKFLVLWVGTTCTLRCESCCNLIPYCKNTFFNTQTIIENLKYITRYVEIEKMQIQGGEPLLHKELDVIIRGIMDLPIWRIDIASNGTIVPSEKVLFSLKELGKRASFHISNYVCVEENDKDNVERAVRDFGIEFYRYDFLYDNGAWFDSGKDNELRVTDNDLLKQSYETCENHNCWVLAGDYFVCCGKILSLMELKKDINIEKNNIIDVTKARIKGCDFSTLMDEFNYRYKNDVPEMCRYCKVKKEKIPAGIQLKHIT